MIEVLFGFCLGWAFQSYCQRRTRSGRVLVEPITVGVGKRPPNPPPSATTVREPPEPPGNAHIDGSQHAD